MMSAITATDTVTVPSGHRDGRGISLRTVDTPAGEQVIVAHVCDGRAVEAVAMSKGMFAQLIEAGKRVAA